MAGGTGPGRCGAAGREEADPGGYARCSTAQQELDSQLDALKAAGCEPIFAEKISTRIKPRPESARAMDHARTIKQAVPYQRVIFTVHEMMPGRDIRPGRRRAPRRSSPRPRIRAPGGPCRPVALRPAREDRPARAAT
ncbi:recombinase family protein [Streptosporangium sp. NPDC006007]|uniref:recombinase family protein n=1 Tax=Streptosporangium sp. NPDC006007 TaxID=3154575 RepID=UPI0033ADE9AB